MEQAEHVRPHHRRISVALVLINLVAIIYALYAGGPGSRGNHFQGESFITWFGSAQMLGAALVFAACYFASLIIEQPGEQRRDHITWLVFAVGFLVLALDQQFRLREQLTIWIEGGLPAEGESSVTFAVLKWGAGVLAVALVFVFRATVLANFRMVVAFFAGLWFLVCMLLADLLVEGIVGPGETTAIIEGSAKLLAIAMFLSASFAALLDRLTFAAQTMAAAQVRREVSAERAAAARRRRRTGNKLPVDDDEAGRVYAASLAAAAGDDEDGDGSEQAAPDGAVAGDGDVDDGPGPDDEADDGPDDEAQEKSSRQDETLSEALGDAAAPDETPAQPKASSVP